MNPLVVVRAEFSGWEVRRTLRPIRRRIDDARASRRSYKREIILAYEVRIP